jgi:GNAT superfamily N-acetyltransferase
MSAPGRWRYEPLGKGHNRGDFTCEVAPLDRYLREQARQDVRNNVAAVFVLVDGEAAEAGRIAGYYTLSATSVVPTTLPPELQRRLPRYDLLPAVLLGRLAIDTRYRGQGLGLDLLLNALSRAYHARQQIAALAVVVEAKDEQARRFYLRCGFQPLADSPNGLFMPVVTIGKLALPSD